MTHSTTPPRPRLGTALTTGTGYMVLGTLVAALAAYGFQVVAARTLGPTAFAPITVLWTIQFLVFTIVFLPMEQLTIRRLSVAAPDAAPWRLFLLVIAGAAAASVAFSAATLDRLLDGEPIYLVLVAVLIAGYGGFALSRGMLAGNRRFREYGLSTMAESVVRLLLAAALLGLGVGAVGLAWSLVAGSLVVYFWRPFRSAGPRFATLGRGVAATLATFIVANAASQTVVAAGPLVVGALGAARAEVSVFFETFLLFRAPLTVSYSLIARVLPPFTRMVESGQRSVLGRWAVRLAIIGTGGALSGYLLARALGPAVVATLLGDQFRPSAGLAAYAGAGMAIATVALFTQQILIAMRATGLLAVAWVAGLATAAVTLGVAGGSPSIRVATGFLAGEVAAFALIVLFVLVTVRRRLG